MHTRTHTHARAHTHTCTDTTHTHARTHTHTHTHTPSYIRPGPARTCGSQTGPPTFQTPLAGGEQGS